MRKGDICEGIIEKVEFPNKGKVVIDGQTITVKNGIPGQRIRFAINKSERIKWKGVSWKC